MTSGCESPLLAISHRRLRTLLQYRTTDHVHCWATGFRIGWLALHVAERQAADDINNEPAFEIMHGDDLGSVLAESIFVVEARTKIDNHLRSPVQHSE